jgi:PKD repeat protein
LVALAKGTKWAIIFAGIGVAAGVGITLAVLQPQAIQQREVIYGDENPWFNPSFLQSYNENLRTGAHYKSTLAVGEEGFFYADAKGGKEPYQFEWKFSDGVVLIAQNATRSFDSPGTYSAQLTVSDADGQKQDSNISVKVQ